MPRTPEPLAEGQANPPSPPRPRFRLKRRNAPHLQAPTQQFLASVAAADIPIPSIEEPHVVDEEMIDSVYPVIPSLHDLDSGDLMDHSLRGRTISAPKTPAPGAVPSLSPKRYPDWSIGSTASDLESSPEYESSRPSTARSTQTSASLFSRYSVTSDDLSECLSPETEKPELLAASPIVGPGSKTFRPIHQTSRSRKAPWTKQMSQHVWFTYMMYLQDPKVTPFRANKSGIPPPGVCSRVAREAKRSWKGSKAQKATIKSGSTTPTGESSGAFMQWPHTCAATRGHLRELCKLNASSSGLSRQFFAHSPTPFGRTTTATRFLNRRSNNARSPSVFSGNDMAMSLTVSTSESMQLQGPLAQLTSSQDEKTPEAFSAPIAALTPQRPLLAPRTPPPVHRLGSPFVAKSYGPSSSSSLGAAFGTSVDSSKQHQTHGHRRSLRSPVRLGENGTGSQKRPFGHPSAEPRKSKRPSLVSDFWTEPAAHAQALDMQPSPKTHSNSVKTRRSDDFQGPRTNLQELFDASYLRAPAATLASQNNEPVASSRTRLGSPFAASNARHSFPRRVLSSSGMGLDLIRRPFATVQQAAAEQGPSTPRTSLATRLAYIDDRLRDFRRRDHARQRTQSSL